jgi:hypothetical protein
MERYLRILLLLSFSEILISVSTSAQTTLISPTGNGGFESGTTFAANGWTEVNGTQTNKWYVGTAATGFTGLRCAYIGTAATNNTYNVSATSIVHFYRDFSVPAGEPNVTLTFSWKGYGESGYDRMRVYVVTTATNPVAGTLVPTGQLGGDFNLSSNWQTATLGLPCNLAGTTRRLVFSWINDASIGTNPPACIDNISLVSSAASSCAPLMGTGVTMVPALPYSSGAGSTCGQGNDLTGSNTATCGSANYLTGEDRVWVFTPASTGQVTIDLNAPTATYTGLMLYLDCPMTNSCGTGSATCIAYDQSSGGSKTICTNVNAGSTYYLVLDSWTAPFCNNYNSLNISAVTSGTLGATCATSVVIPSLPYSVSGHTTACMGNDYTAASSGTCFAGGAFGEDKVYQLTVSSAQCIGISVTGASNNNVSIAVYQGCPGSGAICLGSAVGATNGTLSTSVILPAAGTYYIIIDSQSPSTNVSYNLQVTNYGSGAPNNRPFQAVPLSFNAPVTGDNSCSDSFDEPAAQPSCFAPFGGNPLNTVWYSFVAPASGNVRIRTSLGTLTNTQIAVYGPVSGNIAAGSGNTLTLIACNQDLPPCGSNTYPSSELNLTGLSPGMTYYIMVDGYAGLTGTFSIFIMDSGPGGTLQLPPTPGQDCALAFPVCKTTIAVPNPGPQAVGNHCEFTSFVNCLASGERGSYWYKIAIAANGFLEFDIVPNDWPGAPSTASTDYDFAVWRTKTAGVPGPANCNNLQSVAPVSCNYSFLGVTGCYSAANGVSPPAYPGFGAAYQSRIAVTAGDEYLLIVSNFTNSTSGFTLNFSAGSPIATVPPSGGTLVWTGTLNTDWFNAENWGGCAIPNCVYNVSVSSIPTNQPSITGLTAVCGSLDITTGSTLTLQPNSQLKVCNNFVNNGTINALANSTILMQSDSALQNQTMTGSMVGANKLWNLSVNKPSTSGGNTVTLNNDLEQSGNFTVSTVAAYQGGIFNANGKYHMVAGHFNVYYSSVPYSVYTHGNNTVEFTGTAGQNYFNRGALWNVVMNHTGPGVTLGNSGAADWMTVAGNLTLTRGRIITGANRVYVSNNLPAAVSTGVANSFVEGFLRRALSITGGIYDFPVGTALRGFQRIRFDFGSFSDRSELTLSFNNTAPATPMPYLGPECISSVYDQSPLNHGYWSASAVPSTGVAPYSLTAYSTSYTNPQLGFTVMTRHGASPWGLEGFCNSASPITAIQRNTLNILGTSTGFAIAQALTPLPVEMLYLEAVPETESIRVQWATASEINNQGFEVHRATRPPEFELIGYVTGKGNTHALSEYSWTDHRVAKNQTYYYRLRQVDFDGMYRWTDIVAARLDGRGNILSASPNPYSGQTQLMLHLHAKSTVQLTVYSSLGQVVSRFEFESLDAGIHLFDFGSGGSGFAAGVFTVNALVDGESLWLRLVETE